MSRLAWAIVFAASMLLVAGCGSASVQRHAAVSPTAPLDQLSSSPPPGCPAGRTVYDSAGLISALSAAAPGDVIVISPGSYEGNFVATASGTESSPITLCASRDAVLRGGTTRSGYTFYLNGASWWQLIGFTIAGGQKGVMTDRANHNLIKNLYVHDIGDEGIHLRSFSSDNTIDGVIVRSTGLMNAKFGEGIYVGSANSNWCKYTSCGPDRSDRNLIENSDIAMTAAENIDIKEGTTGGRIIDNHLAGQGMVASAATAWVNVKGNGWTIAGNIGHESIKDGFQVHRVYAGWGVGNTFTGNAAEVDGPGYGFYVQSASLQTVIACSNTASRAGMGLSNISCA